MKRSWVLTISASLLLASALSACGSKGGSGTASTPVTGFTCDANGVCTGTPAGYIGNGTWRGNIGIPVTSRALYQQMALQLGMCNGGVYGCSTVSTSMRITIQLQGSYYGGYGYGGGAYPQPYPYYPGQVTPTTTQGTTTASFRIRSNQGSYSPGYAVVTGNSSAFSLIAQQSYGVQINAQFTDASQSQLNVQVIFNGAQVAAGQIYLVDNGYSNTGYYYGNSGFYGNGGYSNSGYSNGGYIGGSIYIPFSTRR